MKNQSLTNRAQWGSVEHVSSLQPSLQLLQTSLWHARNNHPRESIQYTRTIRTNHTLQSRSTTQPVRHNIASLESPCNNELASFTLAMHCTSMLAKYSDKHSPNQGQHPLTLCSNRTVMTMKSLHLFILICSNSKCQLWLIPKWHCLW